MRFVIWAFLPFCCSPLHHTCCAVLRVLPIADRAVYHLVYARTCCLYFINFLSIFPPTLHTPPPIVAIRFWFICTCRHILPMIHHLCPMLFTFYCHLHTYYRYCTATHVTPPTITACTFFYTTCLPTFSGCPTALFRLLPLPYSIYRFVPVVDHHTHTFPVYLLPPAILVFSFSSFVSHMPYLHFHTAHTTCGYYIVTLHPSAADSPWFGSVLFSAGSGLPLCRTLRTCTHATAAPPRASACTAAAHATELHAAALTTKRFLRTVRFCTGSLFPDLLPAIPFSLPLPGFAATWFMRTLVSRLPPRTAPPMLQVYTYHYLRLLFCFSFVTGFRRFVTTAAGPRAIPPRSVRALLLRTSNTRRFTFTAHGSAAFHTFVLPILLYHPYFRRLLFLRCTMRFHFHLLLRTRTPHSAPRFLSRT